MGQMAVAQTAGLEEWANADIVGSLSGHSHSIRGLVSSPEGRYLLGLTNYEMALWDVSQRQLIRFLPGHGFEVLDTVFPEAGPLAFPAQGAVFSADGQFVIGVLEDFGLGTSSLLIWDVATATSAGILSGLPRSGCGWR